MKGPLAWLVIAGLALVLGVTNYETWRKQQVVENGRQVLLQLRPVDPRSLMQGDFMRLRYAGMELSGSLPGIASHLEGCTGFRDAGGDLTIINRCDETVSVVFMPLGKNAANFIVDPLQELATGIPFPDSYVYTSCKLGYVSSVPVRERTRGLISRSQYLCLDGAASRERKGTMVLTLDGDNVGSFARMDNGSPLSENETRLRYKLVTTAGELSIGAESFFFQEGHARFFDRARYGVLRVDEEGGSVLVGLADENHQLIVPAS